MALKTDYKDDVFSGDRKYQTKDNSDGTISLVDKTAYSQKGDIFSAADINATNMAVNSLSAVATTTKAGLMSAEDKAKLDEWKNDGPNVLHEYVARPASADDIPGDDKKLKWFIFDGGYIIQFSWDNSNWASQLYIPASGSERATPQFRVRNAIENKWGEWIDIYSGIKPQSSVTKSFTLSASSWSSGSYAISDSLITASSNQEILPATTITAAQYNALSKAQIIDGGQSEGSLTLKALGTVPTIDIPIRIIFRGTI